MPSPNSALERTHTEDPSSHPLRVVIVAPRIQRLIGGQEVQAELLLRLWRDDPEVRASYLASNPELLPWVEGIRYLRTLCRFPLYLFRLARGLRDADVVHIFSTAFSGFLISVVPAYCVARLLGKKVLVNYRSGLAQKHMRASTFARNILRDADKVVVPSAYLVGVFREFEIAAEAIPNVVDSSLFSFRPRAPLRPLLLCSRNLEEWYGIDLVLRAFGEIQKLFPEARLWILGEGSQENAIRNLMADLKLKGVELPGRIARERIGEFYEKADLLINASRVDNMPASLLEAFACGLAVVSSSAGGIPVIVSNEENGLLCNSEDWKQLAANVIRLLRDPELTRRLTENAYRQSRAYQWEGIRGRWLLAYRELCSSAVHSTAQKSS